MNKTTDYTERWESANHSQTAIFLWQGFMAAMGRAPFTDNTVLEDAKLYESHFDGLGQDGGALSIGFIAAVIDEQYIAKEWNDDDFPSVYHYDITEVLGAWIAKEGPKLSEFQYGPALAEPAIARVIERYNELIAAWLVTDKLTT